MKSRVFYVCFTLFFFVVACGHEPLQHVDSTCSVDTDCSKGYICNKKSTTCEKSCKTTDDCPQTYQCDSLGRTCVSKQVNSDCSDGETRDCFAAGHEKSVGLCVKGISTCKNGLWLACKLPYTPQQEVCDGKDNDCDGGVDEQLSKTCGSDVGNCKTGTSICAQGKWSECKGGVKPKEYENCNRLDDDCDGQIDEDCGLHSCNLSLPFKKIDFGYVEKGKLKKVEFSLVSIGNKSCFIQNIKLHPPSPHFSLEGEVKDVQMTPGGLSQSHVVFHPKETNSFKVDLIVHYLDHNGDMRTKEIAVTGTSVAP